MSTHSDIAIVGAGIAGLCAALSLAKQGLAVSVIEAFSRPSEVGAGIQIPPNACHVLKQLEVLDALQAKAIKPESINLADAITGKTLLSLPVNRPGGDGLPLLTAHRATLHGVLYKAVTDHPDVKLLNGHRVERISADGDIVSITAETSGGTAQLTAGIIVGADGIWSNVRHAIEEARQPIATNRVALRAVTAVPASLHQADAVTAWLSPDAHLVSYPMRNSDTQNLVAIIQGNAAEAEWSSEADAPMLATLKQIFGKSPFAPVFDHAKWKVWPLASVAPDGPWDNGRNVVLIGDAAHAMEPFAAQGAAMAIEDGFILAKAVAANPDSAPSAFAEYRKTRLSRIQAASGRTAFNRRVYHMGGLPRLARNLALNIRPTDSYLKDLDWLYGYRA